MAGRIFHISRGNPQRPTWPAPYRRGPGVTQPGGESVTWSFVSERTNDRFGVDLTLYLLARLGLVVLVAALLVAFAGAPPLVALIVALVASFPLGLLLFRGLNARVTAGLAVRGERRKAEKERLRAELRGDRGADHADRGSEA